MLRRAIRWSLRWLLKALLLIALAILALRWINPPTNYYQVTERARLGSLESAWVPLEQIAPVMARSAVAAEDANFCRHWGIDFSAVMEVLQEGSNRGASTITQQVAKNVFLWHGRTFWRKGLEAILAVTIEVLWGKRRILEVYLNVAEFDEGVFGIEAASQGYFSVAASDLSSSQSARLAAILPNPKERSASNPTEFVSKRAGQISKGAATIAADGRADCFETQ